MNQLLMMGFMFWGCFKKNTATNSPPLKERQVEEPSTEKDVDEAAPIFDRSSIEERIQLQTPNLLSCYEKSIQKSKEVIEGTIVMSFNIGPKGRVLNLEPTKDALNAPELTACLMSVFSKIQFPAGMQSDIVRSDGTREQYVSVNYPLRFGP